MTADNTCSSSSLSLSLTFSARENDASAVQAHGGAPDEPRQISRAQSLEHFASVDAENFGGQVDEVVPSFSAVVRGVAVDEFYEAVGERSEPC